MISIVTISMNQGRFLPTAVQSVLLQRDVDLEYIIVDAGSTDGSREYLQTVRDPRVRLVLEPDHGPADGLNKGVRSTSASVVGYLNADDLYLADALRGVADFMGANPSIDVVYGDAWIIDGGGRVLRHHESTRWGLRRFAYGGVSVMQQSTFFRRAAFDRTGGFNPLNTTCWDGELLVDLALTGARFVHVRDDWSAFRLHPDGISGSGRLTGRYQADPLQARYREDHRRLVARATRRNPSQIDPVLRFSARGIKLLSAPGYALRRLRSTRRAGTGIDLGLGGYFVSSDVGGR